MISGISADDPEIIELIERKKLINRIKHRIKILLNFEEDEEDKYNIGLFMAGFITDINECEDYKTSFDEIDLIYASRLNKIEIVDFVLNQIKKNNELADCYNDLYCLIINEAINAGNIDIVKHIISKYQIDADILLANNGASAITHAISNGDFECSKGESVVEHYISKWLYSEKPNIIKSKIEDTNLVSKNGSVTKVIDKVTLGIFHNKLFHPLDHNSSCFINYIDVQIPIFKPNQIQKEPFKNIYIYLNLKQLVKL